MFVNLKHGERYVCVHVCVVCVCVRACMHACVEIMYTDITINISVLPINISCIVERLLLISLICLTMTLTLLLFYFTIYFKDCLCSVVTESVCTETTRQYQDLCHV